MKIMFALAMLSAILGLVTERFGFVITGLVIVLLMFIMKFLEQHLPPDEEPLEYFPHEDIDPDYHPH